MFQTLQANQTLFLEEKIVIFIDSDFWHGHPDRFIMPKTNTDYWRNKIKRNKERDTIVTKELKEQGWTVIRLWEYDINKNFDYCINLILKALSIPV